jgi:hypothetical protein
MSRFELDVMISRFLTWAPDGRTLLAVAETSGRASYLIPVDDVGQAPTPLSLSYDTDRRQPGSPQWAPIHSVDPWEPATVAGAALDPE